MERDDPLPGCLDELLAELDRLGEDDLLLGGQEGDPADLREVHPERVVHPERIGREHLQLLGGRLAELLSRGCRELLGRRAPRAPRRRARAGATGGRRRRVRIGVGGRISGARGGEGARPRRATAEGPGAGDLNLGEQPRRSARHLSWDHVPPRPHPVDPTLRPPQLGAGIRAGQGDRRAIEIHPFDPAIAAIRPGSRPVARRALGSRLPGGFSTLPNGDPMFVDKSGWRSARLWTSPLCEAFRTSILNPARGG